MSATTRQKNASIISRLAALYSAAVPLINNGNRSKKSVDSLLDALQLFKEDRLGMVWSADSPEMCLRRQLNRLNLRSRLTDEYYDEIIRKRRDPADWCVHIFKFSRTIGASMFTGALPEFRRLLRTPESRFSDAPEVQAILREIKEKIEPYGLYLGMPEHEIDQAFGPPPEKKTGGAA